jgi:hypothetical protein
MWPTLETWREAKPKTPCQVIDEVLCFGILGQAAQLNCKLASAMPSRFRAALSLIRKSFELELVRSVQISRWHSLDRMD